MDKLYLKCICHLDQFGQFEVNCIELYTCTWGCDLFGQFEVSFTCRYNSGKIVLPKFREDIFSAYAKLIFEKIGIWDVSIFHTYQKI